MVDTFSTDEGDWQGDSIMGTDRIADGAVTFDKLYPDLQSLITNISKNAVFAGIATPTTNPGTPDGPVFYIATTAGTYSNFNGISVANGEAVILQWNDDAWAKKTTGLAIAALMEAKFTEFTNKQDTYNVDTNIPLETGFYTSVRARRAVSYIVRKRGLIITYKTNETTSITEQFIGTSYLDDEWVKDYNWVKFSTDKDVKSLSNTILKESVKLGINYDNIEHYISDNILPVEGWEQGFIDINTGLPNSINNFITSPFININTGTYVLCYYEAGLISKIKIINFATYHYDKTPKGIWLVGDHKNPFTISEETLIRIAIENSNDINKIMLLTEELYNEITDSPRFIKYIEKYIIKNKLKILAENIEGDPSDFCLKLNNELSSIDKSTKILTENIKHYISDNILPIEGWEQGFIAYDGTGKPNGNSSYKTSPFIKTVKENRYVFCYYNTNKKNIRKAKIINLATYKDDKSVIGVSLVGSVTSPFSITHDGYIRLSTDEYIDNVEKKKFMVIKEELYNSLLDSPSLLEFFDYYVLENIKIPYESIKEDPSPICKKINDNLDSLNKNVSVSKEQRKYTLYAYSTSEEAQKYGVTENGTSVFVGDIDNVNAIQRAINSIPNDTPNLWTIYAIGKFICTSYDKMVTRDTVTDNNYRCYISVTNKQNIVLSGVGSQDTLISVSLPDTAGDVSTADYHPLLIKKTKNCFFKNFKIYGHNVRYTVHINGLEQEYETITFESVGVTFEKNTGDHSSWMSGAHFGCDIASGLHLVFKYCSGVQLIGHYTYEGTGTTKISFIRCKNPNMNFLPVVENGNIPRLESVAIVEFINNDMRGYAPINLSPNDNALKTLYVGSGNISPFILPVTSTPCCNIYDIFETYSKTYDKGLLVDRYGNLSNGKIHALIIYSEENKSYGVRNIRYLLEDTKGNKLVQLSDGYQPQIGDFVISENGKLVKVNYMTNAQIVHIDGTKLLEIR